MQLFPAGNAGRDHFHCFSCGAHGDVFDLIKKQRNGDFRDALEWLAERYRFTFPVSPGIVRDKRISPRIQGLNLGLGIFRQQNTQERNTLQEWALERGMEIDFLQKAEIFTVIPPKIAKSLEVNSREQLDALDSAGLIRLESVRNDNQSNQVLPLEPIIRDYYNSRRILFTIRDDRGNIAGFAGRSIDNEHPKYLFSPGFPRGETLYRFHKVRDARPHRGAKDAKSVVDLFVVEGLMDALRMESLGLHAVALLGSQITAKQVTLLTNFAKDLDRDSFHLNVHLLLDADEAGYRGSINATVKLLESSADTPGLYIDVLMPPSTGTESVTQGHDPDELFRKVKDKNKALAQLSEWCESPMKALLSAAMDVVPSEFNSTWKKLPESQRLQTYRDVERRLDSPSWAKILDRVSAFDCYLRATPKEEFDWQETMRRFLCVERNKINVPAAVPVVGEKDENGRLIRALQIAEASTQRREFPVDEGSWDRLQAAIDITIPHFRSLLEVAKDSSQLDADIMMSVFVPKGNGDLRLKALPSPEILSIQQYVLNELLRDYEDCPRFRRLIPAIRFSTLGRSPLETTGPQQWVPVNGETVSFAYAIDMDVIEHRAPPQRTGMFRAYFDCWRDFISFIDQRVAAFPQGGRYHVARLDVRRFYDTVSRPVVNKVLLPAITDALAELSNGPGEADATACAKSFVPTCKDPKERAQQLVDWLCDQSFNYKFENPGSGEPPEQPNGLPQGPDLSAYLANISLFPLDRALSELVLALDRQASEEQGEVIREGETSSVRGAVYARYVDDMVIIARTGHDLARLRTAIEQQLALLGMELNPKTEPLPVMDEAEVREWLTDRRGAALGISGPFEGPPGNSPLSLLEPLSDVGETDRSDSLRILHDPRLDDPETSIDELESAMEVVLAAPDLRHGDKASAARHLWRCVIQERKGSLNDVAGVVTAFMARWPKTKRPIEDGEASSIEELSISELLAALDGVGRFLTSRPDRNPAFSEHKHETLNDLRKAIAELVHGGMCTHLVSHLPKEEFKKYDHMLELKRLVIHRSATLVYVPSPLPNIEIQQHTSHAKTRLLISLAEARKSSELLDRAHMRSEKAPLAILFHEAVARLRIPDQNNANKLDPLAPLKEPMDQWRRRGNAVQPFEKILHLWIPNLEETTTKNEETAEIALSVLVNLAGKRAIELIEHRPVLKHFALDSTGRLNLHLLPTPPGIDVPGLLGLCDDSSILRTDFLKSEILENKDKEFCPQLIWTDNGGTSNGRIARLKSKLGAYQYLPPNTEAESYPTITRWLAMAFRSLVTVSCCKDQNRLCPPTAGNLLGPVPGAETFESKWAILGFCVPSSKIAGQAFLRQGDGLVLEPVNELHDHLWRAGTALADWLGRGHSTRQLSTQRIAAPALVEREGEDWAREAMLRFSLCRLRGKSLPAHPLRLSPQTDLPMTIERVLKRLERFPSDSTSNAGLAHLLATLSEGRALQARMETRIDPASPGGAVALLISMACGQFRADEELAHRLPDSNLALPDWAPKRRPARALFALSERLTELAELDPMSGNDPIPPLEALASATRLLCIESQLRSQALELWVILDVASQLKFQESPPSLAEWNLDTTALLHREQPSPLKEGPIHEDWRNVRELFQKLWQATNEGQRVGWDTLAGITPLGWMVVLGALSGTLSGNWRGGLVEAKLFIEEDRKELKELSNNLALAAVDCDDLPWGDLRDVISAWNKTAFRRTFTVLNRLDAAADLCVATHESSRFYIEASRRRPTEVETSDGRRQIAGWAISWAKALGDRGNGIERVSTSSADDRVIFRWSETWLGDRLVGIGVVQPAMASLAGKAFAKEESGRPLDVSGSTKDVPTSNSQPDRTVIEISSIMPDLSANAETVRPHRSTVTAEHPNPTPDLKGTDSRDALIELDKMQDASWRSRAEKPPSHIRMALFQWEVDDTYRHPWFDLCNGPYKEHIGRKPERWVDHAYDISCAEHRRRELLKSALKACNRFGVEVLVLPEYSVRPETVEWLAQKIQELAPKTSVWAGTYRLPPGMLSYKNIPAWSAILEVVPSDPNGKRIWRAKKYPAPAADEIFNPSGKFITPLIDPKLNDLKSCICELICSEVFLITFPGNLFPLARLHRELLRKFGNRVMGKDIEAMIDQDVMEDIKSFGRLTSISENLGMRRSVLIVPAMTTRCEDYSVLGQAAFLSSGLTTIFCNAVCGQYGHGQSCFIGHDGWLNSKESTGIPTMTPYHGPQPGIFKLDHENGCLGKEEQALVIADIDPVYGAEGKPRPNTLLKPLRLVAHLPVIETWIPNHEASQAACRCQRITHALAEVGRFAQPLLEALRRKIASSLSTSMNDPNPQILGDALVKLAECAGNSRNLNESSRGWLMRRKDAYIANHLADPNPWPPPVAMDWLWVDSGPTKPNSFPEIEVPPFAMPPGGEKRGLHA
jgi:DNA primase catalytic core